MSDNETVKEDLPKPRAALFRTMQAAEASEFEAVVVPDQTSWNDFGYQILADIGLRQIEGPIIWLKGCFAIEGVRNLTTATAQFVRAPAIGVELSRLGQPFAAMLNDTRQYSYARRALGTDRARRLLLLLRDAALAFEANSGIQGWPEFFSSEPFTLAMMRSSEASFVLRRASWILYGRVIEADARQSFAATLGRPDTRTTFHFRFDQMNALRGRMSVIIGPNGCGKTYSLSTIARALADKRARRTSIEPRPEINQVLAFAHGSSLRLFTTRSGGSSAAPVRAFALDPLSAHRRHEDSDANLLARVARAHDLDEPSLEYLSSIVRAEFPELQILVPLRASARETLPQSTAGYLSLDALVKVEGEQRKLQAAAAIDADRDVQYSFKGNRGSSASLGQLSFIRFLLAALANAGPASVFAIDEPENFLHPNLISRFMRVLNTLLAKTHSIAIIATHSPFVVREVQSAQVHVMRRSGDAITIANPLLQTLGANVASISNEVFGDDLPVHLYEELVAEAARNSINFGAALDRYGAELSTEALMLMRRKMESDT